MKRNLPKNEINERVRRERDPIPWRYCFLTLLCGGILVVGFFFAARQHFASVSLGMKNSELRKQRDDLQTEQRRLKVSREVAFSPVELEKVARSIGLEKLSNVAYEIADVGKKTGEKLKSVVSNNSEDKPKSAFANNQKDDKAGKSTTGDNRERVVKTEKSTEKSVSEIVKAGDAKDEKKTEKPSKSESDKEDKPSKTATEKQDSKHDKKGN
jgi:hypothetical protein